MKRKSTKEKSVIKRKTLPARAKELLNYKEKREIDEAVRKIVKEYGRTLELLG